MNYQYKTLEISFADGIDQKDVTVKYNGNFVDINTIGSDGWKLIQIMSLKNIPYGVFIKSIKVAKLAPKADNRNEPINFPTTLNRIRT